MTRANTAIGCAGGIFALALLGGVAVAEGEPEVAPADVDAIWEAQRLADRVVDPVPERGQRANGLYFNGPMQRRLGAKGVIKVLRSANLDAAVLDMKDGEGRVTYDSAIEILAPQEKHFVDMPAMVRSLKEAGLYTIARIVCFSDPFLPRAHPDRAVMDGRPRRQGQVWGVEWTNRNTWLDSFNPKNHDLVIALAEEAQAFGFDEVQLDYVRFPVDDATEFAVFPAETEEPRRFALLRFLRRLDEALTIPVGADVFGLTAFRTGDPSGLGQSLEDWARHLEIFSPMLYVNGMGPWMREKGDQRAMKLMNAAMKNLRRRLGYGPVLRPFMQAFPEGADYFNAAFIAEQIHGARAGGADGFLFWHPASNYATVRQAMLGAARSALPFPIDAHVLWRRQAWSDRMSAQARSRYLAANDR